jgi:hypothetical protein
VAVSLLALLFGAITRAKAMSTRRNIRATNRGAVQVLAGAALNRDGLLLLISP